MTFRLTETYPLYKGKERGGVVCSIYLHVLTDIYIYSPHTHDINYITCITESNGMLDITYPYLQFCHFSPVDNIKIIPIHYIFLVTRYVLACVLSMQFFTYILTYPLSTNKTTPKLTSWMDESGQMYSPLLKIYLPRGYLQTQVSKLILYLLDFIFGLLSYDFHRVFQTPKKFKNSNKYMIYIYNYFWVVSFLKGSH